VSWSSEVDTEQLRRHVVRVDAVYGTILGTGLLVAPGLMLTCAHVVKGRSEVTVAPFAAEEGLLAVVQERSPDPVGPTEVVWPFPDLAILRYDGEPIGYYALLSTDPPGQRQDCSAWGYALRKQGIEPSGDPAAFRFSGVAGDDYLSLKADVARPGLSGAPLVCPARRAVTGLVAATRDRENPVGGWASPIAGLVHPAAPAALAVAKAPDREPTGGSR
jgi:hypothetical protein